MRTLLLELRKGKRTGGILLLPIVGLLGAAYAGANFLLRRDTLLSLPLEPMDILLTQLYGVLVVLNLFGLVTAACVLYGLEFKGNALKKLYLLPIGIPGVYLSKFLLLTGTLFIAIALQNAALGSIGLTQLPQGTFQMGILLRFALYSFVTSLPVLSFLLLIASRFASMWVPLGIGVAGFLSGMALAMSESPVLLLHPFILVLKPAVALSAEPDGRIVLISLAETLLFLTAGLWMAKHLRYE